MAIAVIIWLVAGAVDSTGGYHDTRTVTLSDDRSRLSREHADP